MVDFVDNVNFVGQEEAQRYDPGLRRPWLDKKKDTAYCDVRTGEWTFNEKVGRPIPKTVSVPVSNLASRGIVPHVFNASALPKDAWFLIDRAVIEASRDPLQAWMDLSGARTFRLDGMSTYSLIRDTRTDAGQVTIDMDGLAETHGDEIRYQPDILPLPIIQTGFFISERKLAVSRRSGQPFDTEMFEMGARRISETVERLVIGITDLSSFVMGSSTEFTNRGIYGYQTHPDRITKNDLTTATATNPNVVVREILTMMQLARDQKFYGPYMLYHTKDLSEFMDGDYINVTTSGALSPTQTLRDRIRRIDGITNVKPLNLWTDTNEMLLVQMNGASIRAVEGLGMTTVQWVTKGGQQINFKVMTIRLPDLRSQYVGTSLSTRSIGIVHGTTS
ncbi:MAG: major capsid protein [Planctomycetota bacterium]|jgi:hypothetical protein